MTYGPLDLLLDLAKGTALIGGFWLVCTAVMLAARKLYLLGSGQWGK